MHNQPIEQAFCRSSLLDDPGTVENRAKERQNAKRPTIGSLHDGLLNDYYIDIARSVIFKELLQWCLNGADHKLNIFIYRLLSIESASCTYPHACICRLEGGNVDHQNSAKP